jgi:acetolactate synthase-1/2/3 large subunit
MEHAVERALENNVTTARDVHRARTVAQSMIEQLVGSGIDTFFGIPGGPIISVFHRILLHRDARLIEPRHENGAAFEAMGFHRATGRVPALVVTAGPGITNAVTGVAAAHAERVPMVVLCGDVASDKRCLLQDLDADRRGGIEQIFAGITRAVRRITRPASATSELRAAIASATDPRRPGPVVVVVPVDLADAMAKSPVLRSIDRGRQAEVMPDASLIQDVLGRLASARLPVVLLGSGCRGHEGEVSSLVNTLGIPFMTTPQAKGIVSELHPASLRTSGMSASFWARRYSARGPDVALVLGSDLDDVSTAGTSVVGPGGSVVHVDIDPTVFARNFPTALGIEHPLGSFCRALAAAAPAHPAYPLDTARLLADTKERSPFDVPRFASDDAPRIAPHRALADLERAAAPTDRFVSDIGEHMLFALHYLTAEHGERFTIHLGLGSMGSGIGSAIGLALGDPSRRVICICGDGGMQMSSAEILVAHAHRLPVVYAIFNDARYNMVFHGYRLTHGREAPWSTEYVDFVKWASAFGVPGRIIERPGQITSALLDELTESGPAILDIRQDRDVRIRGDGRIDALRQMSFANAEGGRA